MTVLYTLLMRRETQGSASKIVIIEASLVQGKESEQDELAS